MIERQSKRFIAYPLGARGGKASEGSTYEEAVARLTVSTSLYPDSLAASLVEMRPAVLEACMAEPGDSNILPG
jgi:hypothetical protein